VIRQTSSGVVAHALRVTSQTTFYCFR
jgi:hypothetical protein